MGDAVRRTAAVHAHRPDAAGRLHLDARYGLLPANHVVRADTPGDRDLVRADGAATGYPARVVIPRRRAYPPYERRATAAPRGHPRPQRGRGRVADGRRALRSTGDPARLSAASEAVVTARVDRRAKHQQVN